MESSNHGNLFEKLIHIGINSIGCALKVSNWQEAQVKRILLQLLSALKFLHQCCIAHRDIKMSNLLYHQAAGWLKVADIGMAHNYRKARLRCDTVI